MLLLCNILAVVFAVLAPVFLLSAAFSRDYGFIFVILAVVCFLAGVAFTCLHTCINDGVVTFEYFTEQYYDFFFSSSSGQQDGCWSCNCGR